MSGVGTGAAFGAVCQLPGDEEAALSANLHAVETLVEAGNEAAHALGKCKGLGIAVLGLSVGVHDGFAVFVEDGCAGVVVGRVELMAVVGTSVAAEVSGVLHLVHFVGLGGGAGSELDVLIAKGEGRLHDSSGEGNAGRKLGGGGSCGCGMVDSARTGWSGWFGGGLGRCGNGGGRNQQGQSNLFHHGLQLQKVLDRSLSGDAAGLGMESPFR